MYLRENIVLRKNPDEQLLPLENVGRSRQTHFLMWEEGELGTAVHWQLLLT